VRGDLVVRPEQLRALAVPVAGAAHALRELSGQLGPVDDTGTAELTAALDELHRVWGAALHGHGQAVAAVAQRLHGAAETYEAVEAVIADAAGR
jgi:hypothetical protein